MESLTEINMNELNLCSDGRTQGDVYLTGASFLFPRPSPAPAHLQGETGSGRRQFWSLAPAEPLRQTSPPQQEQAAGAAQASTPSEGTVRQVPLRCCQGPTAFRILPGNWFCGCVNKLNLSWAKETGFQISPITNEAVINSFAH